MSEIKKEVKPKKTTKKKTVTETKKETKVKSVKKESAVLTKKQEKNYKVLNKVIRILAKIARIFLMVFVPFIILSMFFIPIVFNKFEISGNVIKFDEAKIIIRDNGLTFKIGDNIQIFDCNTTEIDRITTFLTAHSKGTIIFSAEATLLLLVIIAIVDIYIFAYIEKLFGNFEKESTPFTVENTKYVLNIAKLLVVTKASILIMGMIGLLSRGISSISIIELLIGFVIYYIFKYGTALQKNSDMKICE